MPFVHLERELWDLRDAAGREITPDAPERRGWPARPSAGADASVATRTNGISAATSVSTWGSNNLGQLGDGTRTGHSAPERVARVPVYIAGVSAGDVHGGVSSGA